MTAPDPKADLIARLRDWAATNDDEAFGDDKTADVCREAADALSAEAAANAMLREALEVAKAWMVTQQKIMLADEGFNPPVTALECAIHAVNKALATSPSSIAAWVSDQH